MIKRAKIMSSFPVTTPDGIEPVWDIATLYPPQGAWSEEEYLRLTDSTNRLIEFTDGRLEFLEMPTEAHQLIMAFLFEALRSFVRDNELGLVLFMGLRVRIRPDMVREPDVVFIAKENYDRRGNRYWSGADLVMEVVSPDDKSSARDHRQKVSDYAEAKIPEYWIVDPQQQTVEVLAYSDATGTYSHHGLFRPGDSAASKRLGGFTLDVKSIFDAAKV
jgi:Uma2 family endonuclease